MPNRAIVWPVSFGIFPLLIFIPLKKELMEVILSVIDSSTGVKKGQGP